MFILLKRAKALAEIEVSKIKSEHQLAMNHLNAEFKQEKKNWDEDKSRLVDQLQKEHDLKLKEILTLTKLDSEQKIKQMQLDSVRSVDDLRNKNIQEMANLKESLLTDHYNKLSEAMGKLHQEGNHQTKFTQEIALKMLEGMPHSKTETKVLTGSLDVNMDK